MKNFEIITDSCCNLTEEAIDKLDVHILSLAYIINDVENFSYIKGQVFDNKAFYNKLRSKVKASTSQVTTTQAIELVKPLLEQGRDVLYIGFSSALSGTFSAVKVAFDQLKNEFVDRQIIAVDTLSAAAGQAILVKKTCKMRDEGKSIEDARTWLEDNKMKVCIWFTIDDLFYLQRGGRISGAKAVIGAMLSVKPILAFDNEGKLRPVGKAKGRKRSVDYLLDKLQEHLSPKEGQDVFVMHGNAPEEAELLKQRIEVSTKVNSVEIVFLEPVIAVHGGPGTMGVAFLGKERSI